MNTLLRKTGWPAVIIAGVVIPFALWFMASPISDNFSSSWMVINSLGKLLGILGVCMYSIALVLMTRIKLFEPMFGGLNRVYKVHHMVGGISLLMLLFHPLALALYRVSESWYTAAQLILPGVNLAYNLGILGLVGMVGLLILTFYVKLPYEVWKYTHKFLGVFFAISAAHIVLVQSVDMESSMLLKLYVYGLIGAGLLAFVYRTLLPKVFVRKYHYKLDSIEHRGKDVIELNMTAANGMMNFKPGQFIFLSFPNSPMVAKDEHPFSISSAPAENKVQVASKILGDYTASLNLLKPGAEVMVEGAYGGFSYTNFKNHNQIWIAGGIGVTPFVSMAKALATTPDYKVDLYYSCKTKEEFLYLDILFYDLAKNHPNFRVITWSNDAMGMITAQKIAEMSGDVASKEVFVCGPPPMMKALREQFLQLGLKNSTIHTEEFTID